MIGTLQLLVGLSTSAAVLKIIGPKRQVILDLIQILLLGGG